jgi:hypothetical protein
MEEQLAARRRLEGDQLRLSSSDFCPDGICSYLPLRVATGGLHKRVGAPEKRGQRCQQCNTTLP